MPAYHITGPPGSGKSTVGKVLQKRGYKVIETDFEPGISAWVHMSTKKKATNPPPQPSPKDWVAAHRWLWDEATTKKVLAGIGDEPVFFVGGAHNEKELYHLFDKRFGLFLDSDTMTKRLQAREPQRWRTGSAELAKILEWNKISKDFNDEHGAIPIDSTQSPEAIADVILSHVES